MKNPVWRLLPALLLLAAFLALAPARPASAHNTGYAGYGCSGWDGLNIDCYRGQDAVAYPCYWVLIGHYVWRPWGNELYAQSWECLYHI